MSMSDSSMSAGNPTAANKPKFVLPYFDRMPAELKQLPNWMLWVPTWNGSQYTTRPIQVSGFGASTANPKHWSSFEDVKQAYQCAVERGYMELREEGDHVQQLPIGGVGLVFDGQPDEHGLVFAGVDFDGVFPRGGPVSSFAAERVKRIGSYVEASVSRTGLHVILKARPLADGIAHDGIEMYTSGRFVPMTGLRGGVGLPVIAAPDAFDALANELQSQACKARSKSGRSVQSERGPVGDAAPAEQQSEQEHGPNAGQANQSDTSAALDFLDDFFGPDKRHLVAIKKNKGKKPDIKAHHFDAVDRAGQQQFITDHSNAGADLYFSPNPVKGTIHKKATKRDVAEARHLWIDLDPRPNEPLEVERAEMLALLTTNLPEGMLRPNRVIDSGRGYWGYWKLATPQPVDGSIFNMNGPLTEAVESYGRGIEQVFGDRFADGCRNIDRIARLPGTINRKTGEFARVLHEFSHDLPHAIDSFPRGVDKPKDQVAPKSEQFKPSDTYEPIDPTDPLLAKLSAEWLGMLSADNYAAAHGGDRSRAEIAFAAVAMRAGIDDGTIARCLMDTRRPFGSNTRASDRLISRVIERAHQYADNPFLEQMNRDFTAGFIGSKFRVARFDMHPRYPLQRNVEFLSKDDFINGVINPRVAMPKFDNNGNQVGTKMERRGAYWLGLPGRSEFDAVTFKPGAAPIIEIERAGRVHRTINTYSGFSVVPDHVDSEAKCAKYLAHVHDNIAGGDEKLNSYVLDWMASGVQSESKVGSSIE